jgi:hypothetical protein
MRIRHWRRRGREVSRNALFPRVMSRDPREFGGNLSGLVPHPHRRSGSVTSPRAARHLGHSSPVPTTTGSRASHPPVSPDTRHPAKARVASHGLSPCRVRHWVTSGGVYAQRDEKAPALIGDDVTISSRQAIDLAHETAPNWASFMIELPRDALGKTTCGYSRRLLVAHRVRGVRPELGHKKPMTKRP